MAEGRNVVRFTLPMERSAPSALREQLRAVDQLADGMRPDLELLLSELVANAVRHSGLGADDVIDVEVRIEQHHVRAQVHDTGRGGARLADTPDRPLGEVGGYGLHLVDQIADRWGTLNGPGTTVWFELME
jgi:anti-sigma regulatory factor (Ser/Thr protein kinase)